MNPTSTLRMRRATAFLAVTWALVAIFYSVVGLRAPEDALNHPFGDARLGRSTVIQWVHPSAADTEAAVGDRILELNGVTSEATDIYDPCHTPFEAWRQLRRQWRQEGHRPRQLQYLRRCRSGAHAAGILFHPANMSRL